MAIRSPWPGNFSRAVGARGAGWPGPPCFRVRGLARLSPSASGRCTMRHISAMRPSVFVPLVLAAALGIAAAAAAVQRGPGRGGMTHDADHQADMRGFHELLDQRANIVRTVTLRPDGIETVTESAVPAVADLIYTHVEAMVARVEEE